MISSLLGSIIMSAVTVAMLIAINYTNKALNKAGRYPLTSQERQVLKNAGFDFVDIENINQEIKLLNFDE